MGFHNSHSIGKGDKKIKSIDNISADEAGPSEAPPPIIFFRTFFPYLQAITINLSVTRFVCVLVLCTQVNMMFVVLL
jgi:hypothetical protein